MDQPIAHEEIFYKNAVKTQELANVSFVECEEAQEKLLVQGAIENFAHKLHLTLSTDSSSSISFSPLSITTVLTMVLEGMSEVNQALFLKTLGLDSLPVSHVHRAMQAILTDLSSTVHYANALAAPKSIGIYPKYKDLISNCYKAEQFEIEKDPSLAMEKINSWVAEKTKGEIKNLLKPNDLPYEAFVILNTLYFKGVWEKPFETAIEAPFYFENGTVAPAQMMSITKTFLSFEDENFQMVEIPYQSSSDHPLTYLVCLPREGHTLKSLEEKLTPQFIRECRDNASFERFKVTLPKVDMSVRIDTLLDTLQGLGLTLRGNLPRLAPQAELIKIITETKVKIDEKGTTATAATAGIGLTKAYLPRPPKIFKADRDHLFFILDKETILFRGSIKDAGILTKN